MSISFSFDKKGIFQYEIKNRFRAMVKIDNEDSICYVQSSSKLSNYVSLKNEVVYLRRIEKPKSIEYYVFAKKVKNNYIILCPTIANSIVVSEIKRRLFSFIGKRKNIISEYYIDDYKSDIFVKDTSTIIEIKTLMYDNYFDSGIFPTVYSERTLNQLIKLKRLLKKGYKCVYLIISLNPFCKKININSSTAFSNYLSDCIKEGLIVKGFSISCKDSLIYLKRELIIEYSD